MKTKKTTSIIIIIILILLLGVCIYGFIKIGDGYNPIYATNNSYGQSPPPCIPKKKVTFENFKSMKEYYSLN